MRRLAFVLLAALAAPSAALAATDPMFTGMDADHDGRITAAEHAAGARAMFEKMDANHDAIVTATEMTRSHAAITGRVAKPGELDSARKIAAVDTDKDGRLGAAEHADGSRRMFAKMDGDGDDALSQAEFDAGHAPLNAQE